MLTILWNTVKTSYNLVTNAVLSINSLTPKTRAQKYIESKPRNKNSKRGELYAFHIDGNNFKVGKTINLNQRVKSYKTIHPYGTVKHKVMVEDIHHSERILHDLLKMRGFHKTQEIFTVPLETLKVYMNFVEGLTRVVLERDNVSKLRAMTR